MDVPGIVESELDGEAVAAEVSLGGENALYVTPSRTLVYQSEGFLSDESVAEYPHDAQRMTVKEGRRKTRISLEYSIDGTEEFTVPSNATADVVHPVLAGVLNASGVTSPDETVTRTFRFDELTLVVTSERLVKHVGGSVWDEDYEEYHFADVTGLEFEDGSVATQLVLEVDGRPERVKISNDRAAEVQEFLQRSLFSYYGVNSLDALNEAVAPEEVEETAGHAAVDFGEGVDPLDAGSTVQPEDGDGSETVAPDPTPPRDDEPVDTEPSPAPTESEPGQPAVDPEPAHDESAPGGGDVTTQQPEPERRRRPESELADVAAAVDDAEVVGDTPADGPDDDGGSPDSKFEAAGFQPATAAGDEELIDRIEALEAQITQQNELLERQHDLLKQLVDELSRDR